MSVLHLSELQEHLRVFADERHWSQLHTPKNLVMALGAEAGELVELYQWLTAEESVAATGDAQFKVALADELADVLIYLVQVADVTDVDLPSAVSEKLLKNLRKYPPPAGSPPSS